MLINRYGCVGRTDDQAQSAHGLALAKGPMVAEAVSAIRPVVEGSAPPAKLGFLAQKHNIEMPITDQVIRLLGGECWPREAVQGQAVELTGVALERRDP